MYIVSHSSKDIDYIGLFYIYWDFRIKFCCVKKRFGFYFDQSEKRNEFLTREKIVSSNHKPRFKRIVFLRAFPRSSQVALSGAEPRNVRAVKPKAHSFANGSPDRDPVFVYEV